MKKHTLILSLIAAVSLGGAPAYAQGTSPSATPSACFLSSWSPEVHTFYGKKEVIEEKLGKILANLSERRVFLQVTQGESTSDVRLYERQKDGNFKVTEWISKQPSHLDASAIKANPEPVVDIDSLLVEIDKSIVANKGVHCVGEQTKAILAKEFKELKGKESEGVSLSSSPMGAFAESVSKADGEFRKSTVVILC